MPNTNRNPNPRQRSPIQRPPLSLPGDRSRKTGAGTLETDASRAGPNRYTPTVNAQSQSSRAKALETGAPSINRGESTQARSISRDEIALPNAYADDSDLGTSAP